MRTQSGIEKNEKTLEKISAGEKIAAGEREKVESAAYLFSLFGGTLSGFRCNDPPTQGSSFLATLGWRTQSLWDWKGAKHMTLDT